MLLDKAELTQSSQEWRSSIVPIRQSPEVQMSNANPHWDQMTAVRHHASDLADLDAGFIGPSALCDNCRSTGSNAS
jgi:hypothetical protein